MDAPVFLVVDARNPLTHHVSHEVAAWRTVIEATPGRYPLKLGRLYHRPSEPSAEGKIQGIVVDNFTPSLWCGNRIGTNDGRGEIGDAREFHHTATLVQALRETRYQWSSETAFLEASAREIERLEKLARWCADHDAEKVRAGVFEVSNLLNTTCTTIRDLRRGTEEYFLRLHVTQAVAQ